MDILDPSIPGLMWVLAICFTIIVADVFFDTEILSVGALVGVSIYVSLLFDVDFKWRVLVGLICWLLITGIFYVVWKGFVTPLIRRTFTKGMNESIHSAVGATAEFRLIDEKAFVYWNGDLWPAKHGERSAAVVDSFQDHDEVKITHAENGVLTVCAVKG
jgi:membrane protein implicated in regulation of membrane protease activity